MTPVNQVFLGNSQDPLLGNPVNFNIDSQLESIREYENTLIKLKQGNQLQSTKKQNYIWDQIDSEVSVLNEDQKNKLFQNDTYKLNDNKLQEFLQIEIIKLIKPKLEESQSVKELLENQLALVKSLKSSIVEESNREVELFKRFREFSKTNPSITYEEFIKKC